MSRDLDDLGIHQSALHQGDNDNTYDDEKDADNELVAESARASQASPVAAASLLAASAHANALHACRSSADRPAQVSLCHEAADRCSQARQLALHNPVALWHLQALLLSSQRMLRGINACHVSTSPQSSLRPQARSIPGATTGLSNHAFQHQHRQNHAACSCGNDDHDEADLWAGLDGDSRMKEKEQHAEKAVCLLMQHGSEAQTRNDLAAIANGRVRSDTLPTAFLWGRICDSEQPEQQLHEESMADQAAQETSASSQPPLESPCPALSTRPARGKSGEGQHDSTSLQAKRGRPPAISKSRRSQETSSNRRSRDLRAPSSTPPDGLIPGDCEKVSSSASNGMIESAAGKCDLMDEQQQQRLAGLLEAYLLSWSSPGIQGQDTPPPPPPPPPFCCTDKTC